MGWDMGEVNEGGARPPGRRRDAHRPNRLTAAKKRELAGTVITVRDVDGTEMRRETPITLELRTRGPRAGTAAVLFRIHPSGQNRHQRRRGDALARMEAARWTRWAHEARPIPVEDPADNEESPSW